MRNREGVIAAAVILGIVGYMVAFKWRPFVSAERLVVTATPSLGGLFDSRPLTLRRGDQSCTEPVPIARDTTEARVYLTSTRGGMSPPAVSLTGPGGYAPTVRTELIAGGDNVPVIARFASPARTTESRLCIRNAGRITINLIGTTEPRSLTLAQTTVNGKSTGVGIALSLNRGQEQSLVEFAPTIVRRASALTGGMCPTWLIWLMIVMLIMSPLGVALAAYREA